MARCIYCGQPTSLFRKQHAACKEQHDYALARIPDFLPKFLESDLPADRFCQLLQEGARASFITEPELGNAVARGVLNAIVSACDERILTEEELARFSSAADALAPLLSKNKEVREILVKLEALSQLAEDRVPDLVDVDGDMPIDLGRGERVVWIFNNVRLYRERTAEVAPERRPGVVPALDKAHYVRPSELNGTTMPRDIFREEARGDLVMTNRNLFFVRGIDQVTRLPFVRISGLRAFSDGLEVTAEAGKRRIYVLDDVWFAANLLAGLLRLMKR